MAETLRRVLNRGSVAGSREEESAAEAGPPVLLLGTSGSGKTALLFAIALEVAGEGRGPVLFLTRRPLQSLPLGTRTTLDPWRLQKIHFQYPPSPRELLRLLCSAHETQGPAPSLLLLDGLEEYLLDDLGAQDSTYLTALLLDTAAHYGRRLGHGQGCGLLVALQTPAGETDSCDGLQMAMLRRYFPAQCWLWPDATGPGEHRLRVCLEPGGLGPRAEWWVTFQPQGEMRITPWPTQAGNPNSEESSSAGGKP
ncbi:ATPase SWSAP1 [Thomomys bottae]